MNYKFHSYLSNEPSLKEYYVYALACEIQFLEKCRRNVLAHGFLYIIIQKNCFCLQKVGKCNVQPFRPVKHNLIRVKTVQNVQEISAFLLSKPNECQLSLRNCLNLFLFWHRARCVLEIISLRFVCKISV